MEFTFDPKKNEVLMGKRGVSFPMVIAAIAEKGVLADFANPNLDKYPGQRVLVVELKGYAYCVPYSVVGGAWRLKTIYPSRRFKHLLKGESNA